MDWKRRVALQYRVRQLGLAPKPKKPRGQGGRRRQGHCWRGHPLSGDNVRVRTQKNRYDQRECRTCCRDRERARYHRIHGSG